MVIIMLPFILAVGFTLDPILKSFGRKGTLRSNGVLVDYEAFRPAGTPDLPEGFKAPFWFRFFTGAIFYGILGLIVWLLFFA